MSPNHNGKRERLNAADRVSYIGEIFNYGKRMLSESLGPDCCSGQPYFYVHDSDAYGMTYNCLGFDIKNAFPYEEFEVLDTTAKIVRSFDFLKELFAKMGNEQSGGMAIVNFDMDLAWIFKRLSVEFHSHEAIFKASILSFILWCNSMHTRMGQTSYYVTLNTGLGTDEFSRFLTFTLLDEFEKVGPLVFKPNIVFKVKEGINLSEGDINFDLYEKALNCTAQKMIPTYLLCDCEEDRNIAPEKLSVMGCRTRVVDDVHGCIGSEGRGNIANISMNLPLIALESMHGNCYESFKKRWIQEAGRVTEILLDRYEKTLGADAELFPTNHEYKLWCEDMKEVGVAGTFKHGTLSIGFIGLSETIELITGKKYWEDGDSYKLALDFVAFMRSYTDALTKKHGINFSLLATAGENISGVFANAIERFCLDSHQKVDKPFLKKGFLTNSFHVDVDSGISAERKLELEGPFHKYANGGSISYVELGEAPLGNAEGLAELMQIAVKSGVRYLGFNFPKDVCRTCGRTGIFDECPLCKSRDITRIRRVSGYLEILDGFTNGKKAEVTKRKENK